MMPTKQSQKEDSTIRLKKLYDKVIELTSSKIQKSDSSKIYNIVGELRGMNNLISKLLESYLFVEAGNSVKAESIIRNIFEVDFHKHVFQSDVSRLPIESQNEMIKILLKKLSKSKVSRKAIEALVFYLYFNSSDPLRSVLDEEFTIPKSITEVQRHYQSISYGERIPFVWAPSLYENSSRKEYVKFVRSAFNGNQVSHDSELLLFREIPSLEKNRKERVLERFFKLNVSESSYSRYIYFVLLENDIFYQLVKSNPKGKIGLMVNEKRKLLRSFLAQSTLREFALLSLLDIGDIDKVYIEKNILPYE